MNFVKSLRLKFFVFAVFIGLNVFAAPTNLFSYVLSHPTVAQMENSFPKKMTVHLVKVEEIAAYRCPNCFDFRLTYSGYNGKNPIKFSKVLQVRGTPDNQLEVSVLKP